MTVAADSNLLNVLLVEDNLADVVFFREAMEANGTSFRMDVAIDGLEAMGFLRRQGRYADAQKPDIVVLDLNLPVKTGQEVLQEMGADPELRRIPVAILTTSTSETWVCDYYPAGRCSYFVKTDDFSQLQDIVRQISERARLS